MKIEFKIYQHSECAQGWRVYMDGKQIRPLKCIEVSETYMDYFVNESTDEEIIWTIPDVKPDRVIFKDGTLIIKEQGT